jgi:hypothetical protein
MSRFQFLLYFILTVSLSQAQTAISYTSKFTILEKNEITLKQSIIKGNVSFNKETNETNMLISFPEKQNWKIIDSILYKYHNDSLISESKVNNLQEISIFKELLNMRSNDFGLKDMGFKESNITREGTEVFIEWTPPNGYDKFMSKATTSLKNNLLQGVVITDIENKDISSIFFEDYEVINGIPVPKVVKQHVQGQQMNLYKVIKFSDVEIR